MLLEGKKGVVVGVANRHSIAWACAQALSDQGARLAFNYAGERLEDSVRKLAGSLPDSSVHPCDVTDDGKIDGFFEAIGRDGFDRIDFLVHSVAYAKAEDLKRRFVETSRDGFKLAQDISAYSFVALAQRARPLMPENGSLMTMSYIGAERAIPNYNVMGVAKASLESATRYLAADLAAHQIRVNAISAGPLNTLAARGISDFRKLHAIAGERAPMRRHIEPVEVANTAVFLASDLSTGITGEVIHVDAGFHIAG